MTTVGEPALSDEVTAQHYALSVRQARVWVFSMVLLLLIPAAYLLYLGAVLVRAWYLARLRPREPWTRAEAVDVSWRVRRNGLADGTATLVLPDGRGFTARLDRAPLDLFANVVREKALWVAGNRVVGFPHYPVVATARFGNST